MLTVTFRFGLSYSKFSYQRSKISRVDSNCMSIEVDVEVEVKNDGPVSGSEVVQLYVGYPESGIMHPPLQLRGYGKTGTMAVGVSRTVKIELDKYAFAFWDSEKDVWRVVNGKYQLRIGFNSTDLVDTMEFTVDTPLTWGSL
jgi:beta-glucosidase